MTARGRWRWRWYEILPEALLAVVLTAFLIDETDAATSALASRRAIALMGATAVLWLAARALAARFLRPALVRAAIFAVAGLAVAAVVVLPAYRDETVEERLTVAVGNRNPPAAGPGATDAPTPQNDDAEPEPIAIGALEGIDHRAEGTAVLYRRGDSGAFVVGLEDIDIQPGPDYDVYVVPGADREDLDGATRLDDLRGNRGTQFYDVAEPELDLSDGEWTVLVWCQTFAVPIANATLG